MTNPVTGWFQLTRTYNNEIVMKIMTLDVM